jgi:hypothetical protein
MTDQSPLERRYRRWLALYPQSFRAEHEEEMVAVLMQAADPDQSRPTAGEAADLAAHGLRRRGGRRFPGDWERAHAKVMFPVRIAIAVWLCFISAMLVGFHRADLWLILLVPAIAAHTYIAYRIRPSAVKPEWANRS